jgi:hypothetical protein
VVVAASGPLTADEGVSLLDPLGSTEHGKRRPPGWGAPLSGLPPMRTGRRTHSCRRYRKSKLRSIS